MLTSCLIAWWWKWDTGWKKNSVTIFKYSYSQDLFFFSWKFGVKSTLLGHWSKFTPSKLFPLTSTTKKKFRKYTSDNAVTMKTSVPWLGRPKISSYRSRSKKKKANIKWDSYPAMKSNPNLDSTTAWANMSRHLKLSLRVSPWPYKSTPSNTALSTDVKHTNSAIIGIMTGKMFKYLWHYRIKWINLYPHDVMKLLFSQKFVPICL